MYPEFVELPEEEQSNFCKELRFKVAIRTAQALRHLEKDDVLGS